jgi:hypothetical protein
MKSIAPQQQPGKACRAGSNKAQLVPFFAFATGGSE